MDKKIKLGLSVGFLVGVIVTLGAVGWFYYPKYKLNGAMENCKEQFGVGATGITEEVLSKYPSQQAFETEYTACVNEHLE
jgi:hypothetical protein